MFGQATAMVIAAVALSPPAAAQEAGAWAVLPLTARGVEQQTAAIFRDLLESELVGQVRASFVSAARGCGDVPCAAQVGQRLGAERVVFGNMNQLGAKIIINVTVVHAPSGEVLSAQKIAVDRVEDLDAAAERIALAIARGTTTDETAQLGNITAEEVAPERRREGLAGPGLRVGGLLPLQDGYAEALPGVLIDASYWYETSRFAIEPRLGVRFDASGSESGYLEVPMDLGAYYLLAEGDLAPFIGGGAGLRYISDRRYRTFQTGEVIVSTHSALSRESAFGMAAFGRAGVLLFRTYTLRVALSVDYNITFLSVNGAENPRSVTAGIGAYF